VAPTVEAVIAAVIVANPGAGQLALFAPTTSAPGGGDAASAREPATGRPFRLPSRINTYWIDREKLQA
jgi:hypothetical protein